MKASDFCTSRTFDMNGLSYVAIAEHCTKLTPNWAPARETAFALNELLRSSLMQDLIECQEGVFESQVRAIELEDLLIRHGFVYNPVLDQILNDFIAENQ